MQVSVDETSELGRKIKVQVPEDEIQSKIAKRLQSLSQSARIDGFRPGKVPSSIIRKRYGEPVRKEVVGELIQSSLNDALQERELRPVGVPTIDKTSAESGQGLEFEATIEIYPNIELAPAAELEVVRPVCEIKDADIDAMIVKLRGQRANWEEVERKSHTGDRLTICFSGTVDGENFTNGTVDDFQTEIGGGQMIEGFEDQLIGMNAGEDKVFDVTFPEGYRNEKLSGKPAEFNISVKKIEQPIIPEVDEEFVKNFGIETGDLDDFRKAVKANLEKERDRAIGGKTRMAVMTAMLENNPINLPRALVDQEVEQIKKQQASSEEGPSQEASEEQLDYFETEARRRVALGLLLIEIVNQNNVKADGARVRSAIEEMAQSHESPDEVVDWYYSNPKELEKVENMVLEQQVVDLIMEEAKVTDQTIDFSELVPSH
jgi:trigger factor